MVFTSPTFLFLFLPLVLAAFWITPPRLRTTMLVAASWVFYAWGEKTLVAVLALSTVFNWGLALPLERAAAPRVRRLLLAAGVTVNIGALVYFKYTNLIVLRVNGLLALAGVAAVPHAPVHLPIGVSFVTFEAVSYIIDVYRRRTPASRNPVHVAFYLSFFPHLIAGPILRFADIAAPLPRPTVTLTDFDRGVSRFIRGLGRKMLLANPMGVVVDQIFALPAAQLGTAATWLGIVCYALQIYFDFSGYSDMAIGLGHMFGFTLPENFRLPYTADSVRDFWRRWHMSLSSWFRDYLFIPLGGSRGGTARTSRNLLLVFLLCGFWHGASGRFIVWGAFHGAFLALERTRRFGAWLERAPALLRRAYTLAVVLVAWVFFRAETMGFAARYLAAMFGKAGPSPVPAIRFLTADAVVVLIVGLLLAVRPFPERWLAALQPSRAGARPVTAFAFEMAVFGLSLLYVAAGTYNPFIYFRF
jgi:alginate O-acetyltransferase complex protein AlgI